MTDPTTDTKMTDRDRAFLALLARSPDLGDGWRQVSAVVWPLVEGFRLRELIEADEAQKRVRLSAQGVTVARYL